MYKHILVPIALDHEAETDIALKVAEHLRDQAGAVTALTVLEPVPGFIANELPPGQIERNQTDVLAALKDVVKGHDTVKCVVIGGHPGRSIVDYAIKNGVDCIVVASHKPGLADYFLGSTAARVVRHAPCAVHVVR